MFEDDEDNEEYLGSHIGEYINRFESFLKGQSTYFFDSDEMEVIIDHYLVIGEYEKAIDACDYALSCFPSKKIFILRKAQAYSSKGSLKEAIDLLHYSDNFKEIPIEFYLTKASIFSQLKNSEMAIKYYKLAIQLSDPKDCDEIFLDIAMEYQYKGDYKSAIQILEEALKTNPLSEPTLYELAFCHDFVGDWDKAIQCYNNYLNENPYSYTAWYNLGNILLKKGNSQKAIEAYEYSVAIEESFSSVYFNLGNAYLISEELEKAEESFRKCIDTEGEDAIVCCFLGESLERQGKLEEAKEIYMKALSIDTNAADAWLGIGIIADLEGFTKKGIELILKAISIEPENDDYYHILGNAYSKINEWEEAEKSFLKTIDYNPENGEVIKDLYLVYYNSGQWKKILPFLESFQINEFNEFTLHLLYVHYLWNNNREEEAIILLQTCIQKDLSKTKLILNWFDDFNHEPIIMSLFEKK